MFFFAIHYNCDKFNKTPDSLRLTSQMINCLHIDKALFESISFQAPSDCMAVASNECSPTLSSLHSTRLRLCILPFFAKLTTKESLQAKCGHSFLKMIHLNSLVPYFIKDRLLSRVLFNTCISIIRNRIPDASIAGKRRSTMLGGLCV